MQNTSRLPVGRQQRRRQRRRHQLIPINYFECAAPAMAPTQQQQQQNGIATRISIRGCIKDLRKLRI